MGFEEGFNFKKKKSVKTETTKTKSIKTEIKDSEGEVEVYGLEVSTPTTKPNNVQTSTENSIPKKLKIPIIKLKDV